MSSRKWHLQNWGRDARLACNFKSRQVHTHRSNEANTQAAFAARRRKKLRSFSL